MNRKLIFIGITMVLSLTFTGCKKTSKDPTLSPSQYTESLSECSFTEFHNKALEARSRGFTYNNAHLVADIPDFFGGIPFEGDYYYINETWIERLSNYYKSSYRPVLETRADELPDYSDDSNVTDLHYFVSQEGFTCTFLLDEQKVTYMFNESGLPTKIDQNISTSTLITVSYSEIKIPDTFDITYMAFDHLAAELKESAPEYKSASAALTLDGDLETSFSKGEYEKIGSFWYIKSGKDIGSYSDFIGLLAYDVGYNQDYVYSSNKQLDLIVSLEFTETTDNTKIDITRSFVFGQYGYCTHLYERMSYIGSGISGVQNAELEISYF